MEIKEGKIVTVLGLQWGDEGKGKIINDSVPEFDIIARFQGGPNAGHTVYHNGKKHVLHMVPSGAFSSDAENYIGASVVLDPIGLKAELEEIDAVFPIYGRIRIAKEANLILPTHRLIDRAKEKAKGAQSIGSTLKGIGPAYTDMASREALRIGYVWNADFNERFSKLKALHVATLHETNSADVIDAALLEKEENDFMEAIAFLKERIGPDGFVHGAYYLRNMIGEGRRVLAEGAQGVELDIIHGSFPYVTSSVTNIGGVCEGLGLPPKMLGEIYGVAKAYTTRVGNGPFVTEMLNETGDTLRTNGNEFGATTGRPRRCGALDTVQLRHAIGLNGVTKLVITKLDVLSGMAEIPVSDYYLLNGARIDEMPFDATVPDLVPHYESLPGWDAFAPDIKTFEELPENARAYLSYIQKATGIPVVSVSVSPEHPMIAIPEGAL